MKTPRFFIDDGFGVHLFGERENLELAKHNAHAEIDDAIDRLAEGRHGSKVVLILSRQDMTEQEVRHYP